MRRQIEPDAEPGYYDRALGENAEASYQAIISRLCHKRGVGFLDLLPAFRKAYSDEPATLFLDADHPNARGHHVAAEAAYEFVLELLSTDGVQSNGTDKPVTQKDTGVQG
jgi:lysophospholipase L1-like esterase